MKFIFIAMAFALSACTTTYTKDPFPGNEAFYHDSTECRVKAGQAHAEDNFINHSFMDNCMAGFGWQVQ